MQAESEAGLVKHAQATLSVVGCCGDGVGYLARVEIWFATIGGTERTETRGLVWGKENLLPANRAIA